MKTKAIILCSIFLFMLSVISLVFYLSEPKYVNNPKNPHQSLKKYDFIAFKIEGGESVTGMVIQIDSTTLEKKLALIKVAVPFLDPNLPEFVEITMYDRALNVNGEPYTYRIIGTGTIYHKINNYAGFNIMLICTGFIIIIEISIGHSIIGLIRQMLGIKSFWD